MAGAQPHFMGNCFYGGGGTFQAQLFGNVWDKNAQRNLKMRYHCMDPSVTEVLRLCFELLVSSDSEREIGDMVVQRIAGPTGLPMVTVTCGGTVYQMTQSKGGSGAARLAVYLPFSTKGEEIDLSEIAKESDVPPEEGEVA